MKRQLTPDWRFRRAVEDGELALERARHFMAILRPCRPPAYRLVWQHRAPHGRTWGSSAARQYQALERGLARYVNGLYERLHVPRAGPHGWDDHYGWWLMPPSPYQLRRPPRLWLLKAWLRVRREKQS